MSETELRAFVRHTIDSLEEALLWTERREHGQEQMIGGAPPRQEVLRGRCWCPNCDDRLESGRTVQVDEQGRWKCPGCETWTLGAQWNTHINPYGPLCHGGESSRIEGCVACGLSLRAYEEGYIIEGGRAWHVRCHPEHREEPAAADVWRDLCTDEVVDQPVDWHGRACAQCGAYHPPEADHRRPESSAPASGPLCHFCKKPFTDRTEVRIVLPDDDYAHLACWNGRNSGWGKAKEPTQEVGQWPGGPQSPAFGISTTFQEGNPVDRPTP